MIVWREWQSEESSEQERCSMECFVWGIQVIYFIAVSCCLLWKRQERRVNLLPITIRQERGEQRRLVQSPSSERWCERCLSKEAFRGRKGELWYNKRGEKALSKWLRHGPPGRQTKEPQIKVDRKHEWNKLKQGHEQHYIHFEDQVLHCEVEKGQCSSRETDLAAALREERPPQESLWAYKAARSAAQPPPTQITDVCYS